jgi:putative tryptophan/tyrosine transport system substrate-binding protein
MPLRGDRVVELALVEGLSALGYVEGRNLTINWRQYEQSGEAIRAAAAELVQSRVDLIIVNGTQAARAVLSETSSTPVVFLSADPISAGLAASLAHPGANATGISTQSTELIAKRLQLLRQIAPRTRHIVMLVNPDSPMYGAILREAHKAARAQRIRISTLDAGDADELSAALRGVQGKAGYALIVSSDAFFIANRDTIGSAVRKAKLPTLVPTNNYWGDGVLMSYGPNLAELLRRVAVYVDKILKGAKPADLPIEQSTKLELIIDSHVAREMGLKVPQELLIRADKVIQ